MSQARADGVNNQQVTSGSSSTTTPIDSKPLPTGLDTTAIPPIAPGNPATADTTGSTTTGFTAALSGPNIHNKSFCSGCWSAIQKVYYSKPAQHTLEAIASAARIGGYAYSGLIVNTINAMGQAFYDAPSQAAHLIFTAWSFTPYTIKAVTSKGSKINNFVTKWNPYVSNLFSRVAFTANLLIPLYLLVNPAVGLVVGSSALIGIYAISILGGILQQYVPVPWTGRPLAPAMRARTPKEVEETIKSKLYLPTQGKTDESKNNEAKGSPLNQGGDQKQQEQGLQQEVKTAPTDVNVTEKAPQGDEKKAEITVSPRETIQNAVENILPKDNSEKINIKAARLIFSGQWNSKEAKELDRDTLDSYKALRSMLILRGHLQPEAWYERAYLCLIAMSRGVTLTSNFFFMWKLSVLTVGIVSYSIYVYYAFLAAGALLGLMDGFIRHFLQAHIKDNGFIGQNLRFFLLNYHFLSTTIFNLPPLVILFETFFSFTGNWPEKIGSPESVFWTILTLCVTAPFSLMGAAYEWIENNKNAVRLDEYFVKVLKAIHSTPKSFNKDIGKNFTPAAHELYISAKNSVAVEAQKQANGKVAPSAFYSSLPQEARRPASPPGSQPASPPPPGDDKEEMLDFALGGGDAQRQDLRSFSVSSGGSPISPGREIPGISSPTIGSPAPETRSISDSRSASSSANAGRLSFFRSCLPDCMKWDKGPSSNDSKNSSSPAQSYASNELIR